MAVQELIDQLILNLRIADLADILVVSILFYVGLQWLRKRAARAVALALFSLALLYVLANRLNMYLTLTVFQTGLTVLLLSLVVIFQQDIRRTFEQMSSWRGFHAIRSVEDWSGVIDQLVETATAMAKQKIGALIVLKGHQALDPYIEGGTLVKGRISLPLLESIFHPATPGHDGAVIIDRNRLEMLGAYLPLSRNLDKVGKGGTRHTAALGLSECCDALIIVVSEERGCISLAEFGELKQIDSVASFKNRLDEFYATKFPPVQDHGLSRTWRRNLSLKLLSLSMATLLWFFIAFRVEIIQRTFEDVPVEFRNVPKSLVIDDAKPSRVKVTLAGSERAFNAFDAKNLKISIDLQGIREGEHKIPLLDKNLPNFPSGLNVRHFDTPVVTLRAYQVVRLELPVQPKFKGNLPEPYALGKVETSPKQVAVLLRDLGQIPPVAIETLPISLNQIKETKTVTAELKLPANADFIDGKQPKVQVTIPVIKKSNGGKINGEPPGSGG